MSRVGNTPFEQLLRDARNLVREEEVEEDDMDGVGVFEEEDLLFNR